MGKIVTQHFLFTMGLHAMVTQAGTFANTRMQVSSHL